MINYYPDPLGAAHSRATWIDLLLPTDEETARIRAEWDVEVPTRAQLEEIESSSRLRSEGTRLYLSMPLGAQHDVPDAAPAPIGFVVSRDLLITVRYGELKTFATVRATLAARPKPADSAEIFALLIEAMVDAAADEMEKIAAALGSLSRRVFNRNDPRAHRNVRLNRLLRATLTTLGDTGEHLSQIRESLMGLARITGFVLEKTEASLGKALQARLHTVRQDLGSLTDFEAHLSGKTQFLLDATLGLVNTEQNDIFKVLTIVSVIGIPPTLIASMYGMNFHNMPELSWPWGYQYGLTLIGLSILLPVVWFKWRRWW